VTLEEFHISVCILVYKDLHIGVDILVYKSFRDEVCSKGLHILVDI